MYSILVHAIWLLLDFGRMLHRDVRHTGDGGMITPHKHPIRNPQRYADECEVCALVMANPAILRVWRTGLPVRTTIGPQSPAGAKAAKPRMLCLHLGQIVKRTGQCIGLCPHKCEKGHGNVRPSAECRTCTDYEPDA